MGLGSRNQILLGLALVMILGIAVYLRLWTIDYTVSADDTELLRRQFDLANKEAMDESAEWRLKYDVETERANKCLSELNMIKESSKKDEDAASMNKKLAMLQKENLGLLEQVEALRQELESEKLKCSLQ
ncbi:hypothetical protein FNV43_RR16741 [Rhamnella rubrinervis]|uniref:Uncharacterized protein n=1 Tax=Rhamnella rubrinervis TaxID=2594499 RepID=A0A8K0MDV7_9ROSA|nr:hypothetical protein FNV43_RR16741 [Rhamnella rubrinervis]